MLLLMAGLQKIGLSGIENGLAKRFDNKVWKVNGLFGFCYALHPWRCSGRLDDGHPWRWITERPGLEESFKRAKGRICGRANVVESTGWGRVFDLVDEVYDKH